MEASSGSSGSSSSELSSGKLVSDDEVVELLMDALHKKMPGNIILDGFPRTINQCHILEDRSIPVRAVVHVDVPHTAIIARLTGRFVHPPSGRTYNAHFNPPRTAGVDDETGEALVRREDDEDPGVIEHRLLTYENMTSPIIEHYRSKGGGGGGGGEGGVRGTVVGTFTGTESPKIYLEVKPFLEKIMKE